MNKSTAVTTIKSTYITNPLQMIQPSANALGINIGTLFALWGLLLSPGLLIIPALIAVFMLKLNLVGFVLGAIAVVSIIAVTLLCIPAYTIILLASANGQKVTLREVLSQGRTYIWRFIGLGVLTVLAVLGGIILFVIPGLIFIAWFSLSSYALVSEDLGVVASMKRSRELVRGRVWEMWGLMSLTNAANIIPFIGGIISFVLSILLMPSMAIKYLQLSAAKTKDRPAVHWANYVVIIAMIFAGSVAARTQVNVFDQLNSTKPNTEIFKY